MKLFNFLKRRKKQDSLGEFINNELKKYAGHIISNEQGNFVRNFIAYKLATAIEKNFSVNIKK